MFFDLEKKFAGDKKSGYSLFGKLEERFRDKLIGYVPKKIETYHLTLSTLLWSFLIVLFSYLAKENIHWLWLVSLMIVFQYLTDLFDGAIGRLRNTGLVRWGYYMDHFLDYVFLCSVLIGYSFLFSDKFNSLFFILAIFAGFMVNSYLSFASTNEFKISYFKIGPTEVRLFFIIINTLIIFTYQNTPLSNFLKYILIFAFLGLIATVYRTQKEIWKKDMQMKNNQKDL